MQNYIPDTYEKKILVPIVIKKKITTYFIFLVYYVGFGLWENLTSFGHSFCRSKGSSAVNNFLTHDCYGGNTEYTLVPYQYGYKCLYVPQ